MMDIYQITRKVSIFTISKRIIYHVLAAVSRNVAHPGIVYTAVYTNKPHTYNTRVL